MSGQKADVRGVIRSVVAELRADGNTGLVENLMVADAAVAELIDAARELANLHTNKRLDRVYAALENIG